MKSRIHHFPIRGLSDRKDFSTPVKLLKIGILITMTNLGSFEKELSPHNELMRNYKENCKFFIQGDLNIRPMVAFYIIIIDGQTKH